MVALKVIGANSIVTTYLTGVSILKKLAVAFVAAVKADSVSRKEPSHYRGKGRESCSKEEMGMIRDEHPCVTGGFS